MIKIFFYLNRYDDANSVTAPRVWWTFKCFNKNQKVAILDGGLKKWIDEEGPVMTGDPILPKPANQLYKCDADIGSNCVNMNQIKLRIQLYKKGAEPYTVIDARSNGRFTGKDPEPRPIPSGHLPGAINIPFNECVKEGTPEWKSPEELKEIFTKAGVDINSKTPIICSCGSGCTACYLAFALHLMGRNTPGSVKVYDGSWCEWADYKDNEIIKD